MTTVAVQGSDVTVSQVAPPTPLGSDLPVVIPPALLPIESDFAGAVATTAFADTHAAEADSFVQQLGALAAAIVPPVINPVFPTGPTAPPVSVPAAPAVVPIVYNPPAVPAPFSGSLDVNTVFPEFTAGPPQLLFPNAPATPNVPVPPSPNVDTNFTYPTVNVTLPAPPNLLSLTTYQFNGVTLPTLNATAPVLTAYAPSPVTYVPNAPYTDALLSELLTILQDRIQDGTNTGLPPAIEQNLWDRAREREYKQAGDAIAALDRLETLGYAFPPGVYIDAQIKIQTETNYNIANLSREIATKQAELIHDDILKAIDQATAIESKLIDYANETEQRRFEACKYLTEAYVQIYNSQVQAYSAMVNAYRAAIDVYNAQIQGQLAYVQAYKAEIEAEQVKAEINTALVQQYKVEVDAALASIEVFKGEIEIIQTEAQVEQLKVSIFGEQVKAYTAQINAYSAQVEAYKATIEAQGEIENVYQTEANVFKTQVEAQVAQINANVEVYKAELQATIEQYEAYKAQVEGQAEQVKALAAMNEATANIYRAEVAGTSSFNEAIIKEYQVALDEAIQVTQIGVAAAQANAQSYLTVRGIAADAAKVGAQVEAQIAASALGAVTYATHRARQDSVSIGASTSQSVSNSNSTSISNSNSSSTSAAGSFSDQLSSSVSTNTNHNISSVE
jgi:hypothetical protein